MRADYYELLELQPDASPKDIKAAYYRLAMRCHPDRNADNPAAEERFKLVAEAYRTLGVPERRREYDNWLYLHNRYHAAPELASMSSAARVRPFHYSFRRAEERQRTRREGRRRGREPERSRAGVRRGVLFRRSSKVNTWLFLGFYVLLAFNLLPMVLRQMSPRPIRAAKPVAETAAVPNEADARRRVLAMEQDLRRRAEGGEAEAQFYLGLYLFNKSARGRGEENPPGVLRRAASTAYRQQALEWFSKAAAQGHEGAGRFVTGLRSREPSAR